MPATEPTHDPDLAADVFVALQSPGCASARRERAANLVADRYGCSHDTAIRALDDVLAKAAVAVVNEREARS